jgi:hypothetical protein
MNDNASWISLAALTANVVRWLELSEKHQKDSERQAPCQCDDEQNAEQDRDGVQRSLNKGRSRSGD